MNGVMCVTTKVPRFHLVRIHIIHISKLCIEDMWWVRALDDNHRYIYTYTYTYNNICVYAYPQTASAEIRSSILIEIIWNDPNIFMNSIEYFKMFNPCVQLGKETWAWKLILSVCVSCVQQCTYYLNIYICAIFGNHRSMYVPDEM